MQTWHSIRSGCEPTAASAANWEPARSLGGDDLRAFYDVVMSGHRLRFNPDAIGFHHHHRTAKRSPISLWVRLRPHRVHRKRDPRRSPSTWQNHHLGSEGAPSGPLHHRVSHRHSIPRTRPSSPTSSPRNPQRTDQICPKCEEDMSATQARRLPILNTTVSDNHRRPTSVLGP